MALERSDLGGVVTRAPFVSLPFFVRRTDEESGYLAWCSQRFKTGNHRYSRGGLPTIAKPQRADSNDAIFITKRSPNLTAVRSIGRKV
jgi:hypothetical protein